MNARLRDAAAAVLIAMTAFSLCCGQGTDMIRNGDFELDANSDGMADSWQFSGDKGVVVNWARDTGFTGQFSQKLQCTQFTSTTSASHAMLCQLNTLRPPCLPLLGGQPQGRVPKRDEARFGVPVAPTNEVVSIRVRAQPVPVWHRCARRP